MSTAPLTRTPPVRGGWNTVQILKGSRVLILLLDALLVVALVVATGVHRDAMKAVGKDAAPSIIAAQHIKAALADMDADAANELLSAGAGAAEAYEARRVEAAGALIAAAENITFGESERAPILALQVGMGSYERLIQRMRDLHQAKDAAAVAAYREAARLMDQTLLPAADALDQANHEVLERTFQAQSSRSFGAQAGVVVCGLLTLGALVGVQVFLSGRTRRVFNPLLLVASLLLVGLVLYSLRAMGTEERELKVAKQDAFTSIHALWRARAVFYQANADESRYLADPAHAAEPERAFLAKADALAKLPPGMSVSPLLTTLAGGGRHVEGFTGYLADELKNITFPGERDSAVRTLVAFERYLAIDTEMRRIERGGQHAQAVALCLGTAEGQSNWAVAQFDHALGETLAINQRAFDASVEEGLASVKRLEVKAALVAALLAVLVVLGLAPRLREYT